MIRTDLIFHRTFCPAAPENDFRYLLTQAFSIRVKLMSSSTSAVVLYIMPYGCHYILYLLLLIISLLRVVPAFGTHHVYRTTLFQAPPPPTYEYHNRLNTALTALSAGNNGLNKKDISLQINEGERSRRRPPLRKKGRRRRRRYTTFVHQESHLTAAGAESLFSLSWWPFSYETATSVPSSRIDLQHVNSLDLPSIDCGWACVSNTEQIQLQQMKLILRSELIIITENNLHEKYPDVYSDLRLLRFLRKSKERDVISAADRYRSFVQWREKNEVDNIRAMIEDCNGSFTPTDERLQTVATYFPMNFEYLVQFLNEGENAAKPAILDVGKFDTRGITEKILSSDSDIVLEDYLNYWIFLYESIHVRLYQQSIQFGQMTYLDEVCDLSGLSLQQFSPSFVTKVMSPWLKMTQSNYPETTRRIYILNPPAIVTVAWKLVTPLLSQGTIDKIRFVRNFDGSINDFVESGSWID